MNTKKILVAGAFTVATAHSLLLLNDGIYNDDWLWRFHSQNGHWDVIWYGVGAVGRPIWYYFYRFIELFPNSLFIHRFISFSSILLIYFCMFVLVRKLSKNKVNLLDTACIALFSAIYPAYQTYVDSNLTIYVLNLCIFLMACVCSLASRVRNSFALRLLSILMFFISFGTESFLVFIYAFFIIWSFLNFRTSSATKLNEVVQFAYHFALTHFELLLLPVLYWFSIRGWLAPVSAPFFADWNSIHFRNLLNTFYWARFFEIALPTMISWSLGTAIRSTFVLPFVVTAMVGYLSLQNLSKRDRSDSYLYKAMLFVGIFLLVFAMLPYIIVRDFPEPHGVGTRISLLVSIPIALILVSSLRLILSRGFYPFAISILIAGFTCAQFDQYLAWQANWVKSRAIMIAMKNSSEFSHVSIFEPQDEWLPLYDEPAAFGISHWQYHWSGLAHFALGEDSPVYETQFVKEYLEKNPNDELASRLFLMDKYNPQGCRAKLVVHRSQIGRFKGQFSIVRQYFYYRFFNPAEMSNYLASLVAISVTDSSC